MVCISDSTHPVIQRVFMTSVASMAAATTGSPRNISTPNYQQLATHYERLHRLEHLASIAGWDRAANMPPGGHAARTAALAEMASLTHGLRTDPSVHSKVSGAEQEDLSDMQRANLREIERSYLHATALPDRLVQSKENATSLCEHAWRSQRPANDWRGFAANLRKVVDVAREEATLLSQKLGLSKYDALMDQYEPGMTAVAVERIFNDMRVWLPGLIDRVTAHQAQQTTVPAVGPFGVDAQRALCERVMHLLDFDFAAGRLDVSTHPFTGGVPEDVRMTTRYGSEEFLQSLMGTVHETGHGRYEQNRPRDWLGQPVSNARSMGIHESQSLAFEMQLGSHPGFAKLLAPMVREAFGDQPAFEPNNLWKLMTRVKRGLIRVDADEVTYPAHVILRFDIERALIEGSMQVDDIPAAWDAGMKSLLGVNTRGNYTDGPMQDVHWAGGAFGYFPSYTLGAMYAAQWFAAMRRSLPDLDAHINDGNLQPVFTWLKDNIWQHGSRWPTDELALRISGETLNPAHFKAHLEQRYLGA
jgi:carboxypeptidase Taq